MPCKMNYTIIGKLENINIDAPCTLRSIQENWKNSTIRFPYMKKMTSSDIVQKYYANSTSADILALWKHFEDDFRLFDYPFPVL